MKSKRITKRKITSGLQPSRRTLLKLLGLSPFWLLLNKGNILTASAGVAGPSGFRGGDKKVFIDASKIIYETEPFWASIKFHPTEYLSAEWGRNLVALLQNSGAARQYVRLYNQPEDAVVGKVNGRLRYKWDHFDERARLLLNYGMKPMVSFYSMPKEIAANPALGKERPFLDGKYVCYSPPKDYKLWQELCADFTRHVIDEFGEEEVSQWYFTGWNEPDLPSFWHNADIDEYFKLYDHFAEGVKSVSKAVRIGGPAFSSVKTVQNPAQWRSFLTHITAGHNTATGKIGSPIDFLAVHTYGGHGGGGSADYPHPSVNYVMRQQLQLANIRNEFPSLAKTPIFVAEWGESSSGSTGMAEQPMTEVRNSQYGAAFLTTMVARHLMLRTGPDNPGIAGLMLCISGYEKERHSDFEGKRTLHTLNGIHKPLLNAYKMLNKMGRHLIYVDAAPEDPCISVMASKNDYGNIMILIVNFQESKVENTGESAQISIVLNAGADSRISKLTHWRIDEDHSNAYTHFKRMGSPHTLTEKQRSALSARMGLETMESPSFTHKDGKVSFIAHVPCNAISLFEFKMTS